MKKNNITELVFILDRSGSMSGLESDTIGGAIYHIGNIHKYARKEDVPAHTMFVITRTVKRMQAITTVATRLKR